MTSDLRPEKRATQVFFLLCGLAMSSWAPLVPFAKDRLKLNDGSLGFLLLFLAVGSVSTMPFAGWLISRTGSRLVMIISAVIMALALPALLLLNNFFGMAVALFVFGAGIGAIDVAMNTHGTAIESYTGKPIMSSLHGLFSVGGLIGPLSIGLFIKLGLSPVVGASLVSAGMLVLVFNQHGSLLNKDKELSLNKPSITNNEQSKKPTWLNGSVLFLGIMCFVVFLTEGAVLDWSALLLRDFKGVDRALSGMGYAFFSVAMAVMRLFGDKIVARFSSKTVVVAGSIIAFIGYICIFLVGWVPGVLLGFVLIGIGAANIVPVFFSAAGNIKGVSASGAIAVMTTIGYTGMLAGPALIGLSAQHFSLPLTLFFTGLTLLAAGVLFWVTNSNRPV
jgi:MFS family permease